MFLEVPGSKVKGGTEIVLFEHVKTHIASEQAWDFHLLLHLRVCLQKVEVLKISTASPE